MSTSPIASCTAHFGVVLKCNVIVQLRMTADECAKLLTLDWVSEQLTIDAQTTRWDSNERANLPNPAEMADLDLIHQNFKEAEVWLKECTMGETSLVPYEDLMRCHIECAVRYKDSADKLIRENNVRPIPHGVNVAGDGQWICYGMHKYFDYVEDGKNEKYILQMMKKRGYEGDHETLAEAWITMMFRAFCWQRLHYMVDGHKVGSEYWNSRQPVYIT